MISCGVSRNLKMKSFISWHKNIDNVLNNDVIKGYMKIKLGDIRNEKKSLFFSLCSNFLNFNLER